MSQELGISVLRLEFKLFRAVVRGKTEEKERGITVKKAETPCVRSLQSSYRHKLQICEEYRNDKHVNTNEYQLHKTLVIMTCGFK